MSICSLSLLEVASKLQKGEVSAEEVATACLKQIETSEAKISALLAINKNIIDQAKELDAKGPDKNQPLWGVPLTIKDAICTKDLPTTAASRILENFQPIYDAFAVEKLRAAGALIIAKNNMDEFAMGSGTDNSAYQQTGNPWNPALIPGGSSGGSAASVVACQCYASLGSDTGGSIRQPASMCGCVGIKPTYGRVSRYGLIAYASSLDQIGPLARNVKDASLILSLIAGYDPRDSTSDPRPVDNYLADLEQFSLKGVKLGIPKEFYAEGLANDVRTACENAMQLAKDAGAELVEISLAYPDAAIAAYYVIAMAEASTNLARFDGVRYGARAKEAENLADLYILSRSQGFGAEVKRRILLGTHVLSSGYYDAYYRKAAQVRRIIRQEYLNALEKCDAIFAPISPVTAWAKGSHNHNPLQTYLMDIYTMATNLAGLPALALPVGQNNEQLPIGMQIIGKAFAEQQLCKIGYSLEQILPKVNFPQI